LKNSGIWKNPDPDDFDFRTVHGLSNELKGKLTAVRPACLGRPPASTA